MKKFEITKEQINNIYESDDYRILILEMFPKAFKTDLEVGKWYKFNQTDNLIYIISKTEYYGFIEKFWVKYKSNSIDYDGATEATPQEVETALISEAKKRGLVAGAIIDHLRNEGTRTLTSEGCSYVYFEEEDYMTFDGWTIYSKEQWATIVETITKEEAEKLLNKKII